MTDTQSLLKNLEERLEKAIAQIATNDDPAHDLLHFKRVVRTAKKLCELERGKMEVVIPAAWLHDLVIVPKNDPRRSQASHLSAQAARKLLTEWNYPSELHDEIAHAITAHSFSANIETQSLEAKIVQDADRLDGLGAIGLARCFATAGLMKRAFYQENDPFCEQRKPDDSNSTIDHFFVKLFKTADSLKTDAGRKEGQRRKEILQRFLEDLKAEL